MNKKANKEPKKKQPEIRVKTTPAFKLKDKTPRRRWQGIHLKKAFGFIPEVIIIEKVWGRNNTFIVRAVMTPEEQKKEKKRMAELKKIQKKEMEKLTSKRAKELAKKKGGEK